MSRPRNHEPQPPPPADAAAADDGFREVLVRLRGGYESLSAAERRVGDAVAADPQALIRLPLRALADSAGVSDATVVRFCKALGYDGLRGLKRELVAKALSPARAARDALAPDDDLASIVEKVFGSNIAMLRDTLELLDRSALAAAVEAILTSSRIEFYAVGPSLGVALDAHYRLLRLGLPATAVSDVHLQATSAANLPPGAVAFAISHYGKAFETHSSIRWAKQAGATCIVLTSYRDTPLSRLADIALVVAAPESASRPEGVATRIAHLAVVDALSVAIALRRPQAASTALLRDYEIIGEREVEK